MKRKAHCRNCAGEWWATLILAASEVMRFKLKSKIENRKPEPGRNLHTSAPRRMLQNCGRGLNGIIRFRRRQRERQKRRRQHYGVRLRNWTTRRNQFSRRVPVRAPRAARRTCRRRRQ